MSSLRSRVTLLIVVGVLGLGCRPARPGSSDGPVAGANETIVTLAGDELEPRREIERPTVFIFVRRDCPISNRYAPTLRELHRDFADRFDFVLVYPNPDAALDDLSAHRDEFDLPGTIWHDPHHTVVVWAEASITPEAAIWVPQESSPEGGGWGYRGRIDDRFVDFGETRAKPTRHDLRVALEAIANGRRPEIDRTEATGCSIEDLR